MRLVLILALLSCVAASIIAFSNGHVAWGVVIALLAVVYLLFWISLRSLAGRRAVFAGMVALGIGAIYSALYIWLSGTDFRWSSDAALYDAVAQNIAAKVPFYTQINPFSFEYVRDLGLDYGKINQPGFFKLSGIAYTAGARLGIENIPIQIPLIIQIISFSVVGMVLAQVLTPLGLLNRMEWFLWATFMTTPFLLDHLVWLRKDLTLLMFSLIALRVIQQRNRLILAMILIAVTATIRWSQAVSLMVLLISYQYLNSRWPSVPMLARRQGMVLFSILTLLFAGVAFLPQREVAPESLAALLSDQESASIGFSRYMTKNIFGSALYGLLYPFPSLVPKNIRAFFDSLYAYLHIGLLAAVILFMVLIGITGRIKHVQPFSIALWITLLVTLAGYVLAAMLSWKQLGFVVFEGRFKLLGTALSVVLFARLWRSRHGLPFRW